MRKLASIRRIADIQPIKDADAIEPHGDGYALYYGRCNHRHGYNLINMVEPAWNFEPAHIEKLINLGAAEYAKNPDGGNR